MKIIEDRECLNKFFDCSKFILLAEQEIGKIFKVTVAANMPNHLGVIWEFNRQLSRSGAIIEANEAYRIRKVDQAKQEEDIDEMNIKIDAEYFYP